MLLWENSFEYEKAEVSVRSLRRLFQIFCHSLSVRLVPSVSRPFCYRE